MVRTILENRLTPETRLPSSRALAAHLGISRLTVTIVYQELTSQGYLQSRDRSGYFVAETVPHRRISPQAPVASRSALSWDEWIPPEPARRRVIRKPEDWRTYEYPFIYGQPDPDLFDHTAWRECVRQSIGRRDFSVLATDSYGRDDPTLVDYICSNTLPRRGITATPDQVLITLGAQNALYMAVDLLAGPERLTVMEEPGYPDFAEILARANCPVHYQPIDALGLNPAQLPDDVRLLMVTPSHNIPTGATMPLSRRRELLARAEAHNFLIIEDDYDFEMSYLAPPEPSLKSLDQAGRVIYVGSFSKSLFPGLRIGYMVGDSRFISQARRLRSSILRHPPGHLQRVTAYFLAQGHFDAHIVRMRHTLRTRRAAMVEALSHTRLGVVGASRQGGSSVWLTAPVGIDSGELAASLTSQGVLIEPGSVFFDNPPTPCPLFRLGYSSISEQRIAKGIALIDRAVSTLLRDRG